MSTTNEATPTLTSPPPTQGERTRTRAIVWGVIWAISAIIAIAGYIGHGGLEGAIAFGVLLPGLAGIYGFRSTS